MVCSKSPFSISIMIARGLRTESSLLDQLRFNANPNIPSPKSVSAQYWMVLGMVVHMHICMVSLVDHLLMTMH
jgi:hypothetical protein